MTFAQAKDNCLVVEYHTAQEVALPLDCREPVRARSPLNPHDHVEVGIQVNEMDFEVRK